MEPDRSKDSLIWQGTDYRSRTVSLYEHERDHILEHEIMGENFTAIYETVERPDSVFLSTQSPEREVFFKVSEESTYKPMLTKVIVDYDTKGGEGYVVSAWPQREEKGGIGNKLYPK